MSIGATAVALTVLGILFMRGGGGRIALTLAILAGGVVGVIGTLGAAVYGGIGQVVVAIIRAVG